MSKILTPDIVHKPEAEAAEPQLQRPPMFRVIMLNDDYTPMEFVVDMLVRLFNKSPETANQLMLQVHNHGSAVCGVYPYDIAESKMSRLETISRNQGHPLRCMMEQDTDD
jgi:ATP-dependent Clp protease adaptor protein ClpS